MRWFQALGVIAAVAVGPATFGQSQSYSASVGFGQGWSAAPPPVPCPFPVNPGGTYQFTLVVGIFNAQGFDLIPSPPGVPQPSSNRGLGTFTGTITSSEADIDPRPVEPRVVPFTSGSGNIVDGPTTISFVAERGVTTVPWPVGEPVAPQPMSFGSESFARVFRFSITVSNNATPRDIVIDATGTTVALANWAIVSQVPPGGAPGSTDWTPVAASGPQPASGRMILRVGPIVDCDSNGQHDTCEPFVDCNNNNVRDACDIAAGTSQDCNGDGVPDDCQGAPFLTRLYDLVGNSHGVGWSWCIESTNGRFPTICDSNVPFVPAGPNTDLALAQRFADSINAHPCPPTELAASAYRNPPIGGIAYLKVVLPDTLPFRVCVGAPGALPPTSNGCCPAVAITSCPFNPTMSEVALSGLDCNGNGDDDTVDLAFAASLDADGDGVPDECTGGSFYESFNLYPLGPVCPQGGWEPWEGQGDACFAVSDEAFLSGVSSLKLLAGLDGIGQGNDSLHRLSAAGGRWTFRVMTFVPEEATGRALVILLSAYGDPGYPNTFNTLLRLNADNGLVSDDFTGAVAELVRGRWAELRAQIDLDADTVDYFYDGVRFFDGGPGSWSHGVGRPQIDAVDFYGDVPGVGTSGMFVDDVSLVPTVMMPVPCPPDWTGDGVLNSDDFFAYLADYFAGKGDYNNDGTTNSDDYFAFLGGYFAGCG